MVGGVTEMEANDFQSLEHRVMLTIQFNTLIDNKSYLPLKGTWRVIFKMVMIFYDAELLIYRDDKNRLTFSHLYLI